MNNACHGLYRYQPRGIVVFSAHWDDPELLGQFQMILGLMSSSLLVPVRLLILHADLSAVSVESTFTVTDYGAENPLLYDVSLLTACDSGWTSPRLSQADIDDQSFRIHLSFTSHPVLPAPAVLRLLAKLLRLRLPQSGRSRPLALGRRYL